MTTEVADLVESAALVAVTQTVCEDVTLEGAVYRPPDVILPDVVGKIDQDTAVFVVPCTEALNCCVCDATSVTWFGFTLMATGAGGVSVIAD